MVGARKHETIRIPQHFTCVILAVLVISAKKVIILSLCWSVYQQDYAKTAQPIFAQFGGGGGVRIGSGRTH